MAIFFTLLLFAILVILGDRRQGAETTSKTSSNRESSHLAPNSAIRKGDTAELCFTLVEGQDLSLADS
jgi:hypothetical protein